jgi:hypothetical protein
MSDAPETCPHGLTGEEALWCLECESNAATARRAAPVAAAPREDEEADRRVDEIVRKRRVAAPAPETPRAAPCTATMGPDEDDPHVYRCDRKAPHRLLHSTGPEGEEIAWWCSCPECRDRDGGVDCPLQAPAAAAPAPETPYPNPICRGCGQTFLMLPTGLCWGCMEREYRFAAPAPPAPAEPSDADLVDAALDEAKFPGDGNRSRRAALLARLSDLRAALEFHRNRAALAREEGRRALWEEIERIAVDCERKGYHPPLDPESEAEADQRFIFADIGHRLRVALLRSALASPVTTKEPDHE